MTRFSIMLIVFASLLTGADNASAFELSSVPTGQIHGFISQGFAKSTSNNYLTHTDEGSFEFAEVGLNYSQRLTDRLNAGIQFFYRNFGLDRNRRIVVDYAVADWRWRDYLGARVGRVKLPYGLWNEIRDADVARTWILLPGSVYDDGFREFVIAHWGGELYGIVPLSFMGQLEYQGYGGAVVPDPKGAQINEIMTRLLEGSDGAPGLGGACIKDPTTRTRYVAGGRLQWHTPLEGLMFAISAAWGENQWAFKYPNLVEAPTPPFPPGSVIAGSTARVTLDLDVMSWVASVLYQWRWLTLSAEYARLKAPIKVTLVPSPGLDEVEVTTLPVKREGFYGAAEVEVLDDLVLGGYWSVFFPDRDNRGGPSQYQRDMDLTLRYDFNDYVTIKAEAHRFKGYAQLSRLDNQEGLSKVWYLYLARVTVSF